MNRLRQIVAVLVMECIVTSCSPVSDTADIRQSIPVTLEQSVKFELLSLRRKEYPVGICCAPEIWRELTKGSSDILVSLEKIDSRETQIWGVGGTESDGLNVTNFHYLFMIDGLGNATVNVRFPNKLSVPVSARIVVKRSPSQFP